MDNRQVAHGAVAEVNYYWWNVAGWRNTRHGLEDFSGGSATVDSVNGSVASNQWYDLKVELRPGRIQCYINDKLIQHYEIAPASLSVSATLDRDAGELIVKLVNPSVTPIKIRIQLEGVKKVASRARLISMSGEKDAVNTFDKPDAVKPVRSEIDVAPIFSHTIPAMAVQVLRVNVDKRVVDR
jgi:alpha-L-arabinofuranosidase